MADLTDELHGPKEKKEQLFKKVPSKELVESILKLFIPNGFEDIYYQFSRKMIIEKGVVEKLEEMRDLLKEHYMNCKHKLYLEGINPKKAVTILRQMMRLYQYRVVSMEKYYNGKKYLLYKVEKIEIEKEIHQKSLLVKIDLSPIPSPSIKGSKPE